MDEVMIDGVLFEYWIEVWGVPEDILNLSVEDAAKLEKKPIYIGSCLHCAYRYGELARRFGFTLVSRVTFGPADRFNPYDEAVEESARKTFEAKQSSNAENN